MLNPAWPVLVLALVATLAPKIWLEARSAQVDGRRLDRDVVQRLQAMGFSARREMSEPGFIVVARRGDCRTIVRNGDRARELGHLFRMQSGELGPVLIGYRSRWTARPASGRSVMERMAQDGVGRLGLSFDRPAVLAVAQGGPCPDIRGALGSIEAHSALAT